MSAVVPFSFEGNVVRTTTRDGDPWFVATDVCRTLGIQQATRAVDPLDDDEKGVSSIHTPGGTQDILVVSEGGLYTLILRSRLATKPGSVAHRFRRWVTAEVLPAIRRQGGYMVAAPDETPEQLALRAMTVLQATVDRQKAQLAETMPKAEALDRIATADGSLNITDAAKALQARPKDLFAWMQRNNWIYRRVGSDHWCAYQPRIQAGLLEHKVTTVSRSDGSEKVTEQVRVTPKGLARMAAAFPQQMDLSA